jgi:hypothetical protein
LGLEALGHHSIPDKYAESIAVEAYFSYPQNGRVTNGILLLPDIIRHAFINSQLVADQFAANSYLVVILD